MSFLARLAWTSRSLRLVAVVVALVTWAAGCHGVPPPALVELTEARRLAADLRIQFSLAADAANRAVMAETNEASKGFARDADRIGPLVEKDIAALTPLLRSLRLPSESKHLDQFQTRYAEYRKLERSILELAIEHTNLEAQRLSFDPARQAADRFRDALGRLSSSAKETDRCRVEALVAKAVLAVREIQVRHAPHIAAADDAVMTRLEKEMSELADAAVAALSELAQLVEPNSRAPLDAARAALDQFKSVSAQIVALSRRNSNVRSLNLSLGPKSALGTACDQSLRALQDGLAKAGFYGTR